MTIVYKTGNGATKGGFSYLDIQLGGNGNTQNTNTAAARWLKYPNNFIFSGYWHENVAANIGSRGTYASRSSSNSFQTLEIMWDAVYPGTTSNKYAYYGVPVRCLTP